MFKHSDVTRLNRQWKKLRFEALDPKHTQEIERMDPQEAYLKGLQEGYWSGVTADTVITLYN